MLKTCSLITTLGVIWKVETLQVTQNSGKKGRYWFHLEAYSIEPSFPENTVNTQVWCNQLLPLWLKFSVCCP